MEETVEIYQVNGFLGFLFKILRPKCANSCGRFCSNFKGCLQEFNLEKNKRYGSTTISEKICNDSSNDVNIYEDIYM